MQTYEVAVAFPYAGRTRHVGERIEISDPNHVRLLILLRKIREPASKRSTYKRRDMRPEG
ncbi:hypothetical protein DR62_2240 [Burkholderia thailandensis]|uniref:hypothetical protein n=1 Tax=Burkholderia thailandensis TaxID=57975 RepID=UPI0004F5BDB2|nr:hypothetical protein [Burkholderia thailandensis]AIP64580.1 hypothetical protein DR62_2240 [Burkholderia thailandensis]AOI52482.1 hypothetical protein WI24_12220 [Burkholderia thailandensis]